MYSFYLLVSYKSHTSYSCVHPLTNIRPRPVSSYHAFELYCLSHYFSTHTCFVYVYCFGLFVQLGVFQHSAHNALRYFSYFIMACFYFITISFRLLLICISSVVGIAFVFTWIYIVSNEI